MDVSLVIDTALRAREVVGVSETVIAGGVGVVADATVDVGGASAQLTNNTQVPSAINRSNSSDSLGRCCMGLLSP
jgi:hypothetical protein